MLGPYSLFPQFCVLSEEISINDGLRNTLKTNWENLSDCLRALFDVTATSEDDSGVTYIVQGQLSLETEGLCWRERDVMNWLEALLEKHLQERFKSKGAELISLILNCWRED